MDAFPAHNPLPLRTLPLIQWGGPTANIFVLNDTVPLAS